MKTRPSIWSAGSGLLIAVLLASCGGTGADNASGGTSKSGTDDAAQEQIEGAQTELGTILVDAGGNTLYMFTQDSPGESTCEDACLAAWSALPGDVKAGEGVDESLLGTIERSDGSTQTTYADWPLYYSSQDQEAGDMNGQGVSDVWYVLGSDGQVIKDAAPAGSSGGSGGGY